MSGETTIRIQKCLDRLKGGDPSARDDLMAHACGRLDLLARRIFADFSKLKRWVDCEDVLQNACIRLTRAIGSQTPGSTREFFRLAALQIRRELLDLARHYYGPEGIGAHYSSCEGSSIAPVGMDDSTQDPARLAEWTEWHDAVGKLPEEEREVFDLMWYHGLTQPEVAGVLDISLRTVKRRWQRTRLLLHGHLNPSE